MHEEPGALTAVCAFYGVFRLSNLSNLDAFVSSPLKGMDGQTAACVFASGILYLGGSHNAYSRFQNRDSVI